MPDIDERLTKLLADLPRKLACAARYALDNPDRIAFDSMRTVAAACEVTSPTMLRLAQRLDYDNYEAFRDEFRQNVVHHGFGTRADALRVIASSQEKDHLSEKMAQAATQNIAQAMSFFEISALDEFTRSVAQSDRTFILATGSMNWLAAMMESTGVMAIRGLRADHSGSATLVETIADITEKDTVLVLAIAPYAKKTVEAAAFARSRGARVYALTDKRSSPLVEYADRVFLAPANSPHFFPSVVSTVLMIEILLSAIVAASDTLDRIRQSEQLRIESGAYL